MIRALINTCVASVLVVALHSIFAAETIKIAYVGAFSGPVALINEEVLKDFRASADIVSARNGLASGQQIEILPFDNGGNPQDALIALKRVIDQNISFITSSRSNIALVLSDAIRKHNERNPDHRVLLFIYEAGDPDLTEAKCNFWTFRFNPHTDMHVKVLTDYIATQAGIKRIYLVNEDYAFGQSVSRAAQEMLRAKRPDIQIVGNDFIPLQKVKDFAPYIAKIRAAGADSVFTSNWSNDLSLLVKAGNEMGLQVRYFTILGGIPGTWANISGGGGERVTSLDPWHINAADPIWQARLLSYKSKYNATSNMDYLPPMRIVEMLAAAINQAGTSDPMRVAKTLEGLHFAGPSGESWMRAEDHQMIAPVYVLRLTKVGQTGVKYDVDGSGYGWKTELLVPANETLPALKCKMERPPMQ